jgi:pimeloyl-ACP methyl ester carboxylesterase
MAVRPEHTAARDTTGPEPGADSTQGPTWPFTGFRDPPDATPAGGPDPYGDPDPEWLRIDWRQHLRQMDVDGARVNYCEMGEGGTPIVFVHGLAGCWQNWLENIPRFARHHRVIALDLPGFGDSPMPPWEISISNYGRLVDEFCRRLNLHGCVLVGNSMGGFIAAETAIAEPEWVERLVLVSAAGISSTRVRREPTEAIARMMAAAAPLTFQLREHGMRRWRLRYAMFRNIFHAPHRLRPELLWEFSHGAQDAPAFLPALGTLLGYDFLDRLKRVRVLTLIVWGRDDRVIPAADALEYRRHLGNSRLAIFDRCGHVPMAERPVRFNRLLDEFHSEDGPTG